MGAVVARTNLVMRRLELPVPPLTSREGRGAGGGVQSPLVNDLITCAYIMKIPFEKKGGGGGAEGVQRAFRCGRVVFFERARSSSPLPTNIALCTSSVLAGPELLPFMTNQSSSKRMAFWTSLSPYRKLQNLRRLS